MPGFGSLEPCVGNSIFRISSKRNLEVQGHITLMQRYIIQSTSYVTIEGFFFSILYSNKFLIKTLLFLKEHLYIQTISRSSRSDGLIRK